MVQTIGKEGGEYTFYFENDCSIQLGDSNFILEYQQEDKDWITSFSVSNDNVKINVASNNNDAQRICNIYPIINQIKCNGEEGTNKILTIRQNGTGSASPEEISPKEDNRVWNYAQGVASEPQTVAFTVVGNPTATVSNVKAVSNSSSFEAHVNEQNEIVITPVGAGPELGKGSILGRVRVTAFVNNSSVASSTEIGVEWEEATCGCDDSLIIEKDLGWEYNNVTERFISMNSVCGNISNPSASITEGGEHFTASYDEVNNCVRIMPIGNEPSDSNLSGKCAISFETTNSKGETSTCSKEIDLTWYASTSTNNNYCYHAYLGNRYSQWSYDNNATLMDYLHSDNASYKFASCEIDAASNIALGDGWYRTKDKDGKPGHFQVKVELNNQSEYQFYIRKYGTDAPSDGNPYNEYCKFYYKFSNAECPKTCTDKLSLCWLTKRDDATCSCKNIQTSSTLMRWKYDDRSQNYVRLYKKGNCDIIYGSVITNTLKYFDVSISANTNNDRYDGTYNIYVTPKEEYANHTEQLQERLEVSCNLQRDGVMECSRCALIYLTWEKNITECTDLDFYTPSSYVGRIKAYEEEYEKSSIEQDANIIMCANTNNILKVKTEITIGTSTTIYESTRIKNSDGSYKMGECKLISGEKQWLYLNTSKLSDDRSGINPYCDFSYCIGKVKYYIDANTTGNIRTATITVYPYLDGTEEQLCTRCLDNDWGPCNKIVTIIRQKP